MKHVPVRVLISAPPPGSCPCCYTRAVLASLEKVGHALLAAYYDECPPKMGDYCGETPAAVVGQAEQLLRRPE